MYRRDIILLTAGLIASRGTPSAIPEGYELIWSDEFRSLSLRSGGPTDIGLQAGKGTWSSPGTWWTSNSKGVQGYAYDWLADPSYHWPDGYRGPFAITSEGLRIRSQPASSEVAAILPLVRGIKPWLSGQINTWHAVRITPPFYFEASAKMPKGVGRPWPAIWLMTGERHPNVPGQEYEIDIHEGFGDSNKMHSGIHWNPYADKRDYLAQGVVETQSIDLSADFNIWGCDVAKDRQVFFFNGTEVGRIETPVNAKAEQPYGIILDVAAGIPWKDGGPPSDGPHDMIVRYVRLYAPNRQRLVLNHFG